jgi:hypothetical protein
VAGSALLGKYGTAVDNPSAYEKLTGKAAAPTGPAAPGRPPVPGAGAPGGGAPGGGPDRGSAGGSDLDAEARRIEEEILGRPSSRPAPTRQSPDRARVEAPRTTRQGTGDGMMGDLGGVLEGALGGGLKSMARSIGTQLGRELLRGVFGTSSRRRRR